MANAWRSSSSFTLLNEVGPVVSHEVGVGNEGCTTLLTLVGLLPRVGSLVHSEARPLPEGLATLIACVRFFPIMDSLMNKKV